MQVKHIFSIFFSRLSFFKPKKISNTLNLEIFASVLFSRNFTCAKFHENKTLSKMAKSLCRLLM